MSLLKFKQLCPLTLFFWSYSLPFILSVCLWTIQLTRTLLSLIYGPLYLQGDTQHNEEGIELSCSLSVNHRLWLHALLPQLCFLHQILPVVFPAQWKAVLPLLLIYGLFLSCNFSELKWLIFTAHALPFPPSAPTIYLHQFFAILNQRFHLLYLFRCKGHDKSTLQGISYSIRKNMNILKYSWNYLTILISGILTVFSLKVLIAVSGKKRSTCDFVTPIEPHFTNVVISAENVSIISNVPVRKVREHDTEPPPARSFLLISSTLPPCPHLIHCPSLVIPLLLFPALYRLLSLMICCFQICDEACSLWAEVADNWA